MTIVFAAGCASTDQVALVDPLSEGSRFLFQH